MKMFGLLLTAGFIVATPLAAGAQARIPPGQMPPAGLCRVWYDDRSPGRQPAATDCDTARAIAARDRSARVIYGEPRGRDDERSRDRDIVRPLPYPESQGRFPSPGRAIRDVAFNNGLRDGIEQGRRDGRDNNPFNPTRTRQYRSASRGYDRQYGSRDEYRSVYRDGFEQGYADGYRRERRADDRDDGRRDDRDDGRRAIPR